MKLKLIISICIFSLQSFTAFAEVGDVFWCDKIYSKVGSISAQSLNLENYVDETSPEVMTISVLKNNLLSVKSKNGSYKYKYKNNNYTNKEQYYSIKDEFPSLITNVLSESLDWKGASKNDGIYFWHQQVLNSDYGMIALNHYKCTKS